VRSSRLVEARGLLGNEAPRHIRPSGLLRTTWLVYVPPRFPRVVFLRLWDPSRWHLFAIKMPLWSHGDPRQRPRLCKDRAPIEYLCKVIFGSQFSTSTRGKWIFQSFLFLHMFDERLLHVPASVNLTFALWGREVKATYWVLNSIAGGWKCRGLPFSHAFGEELVGETKKWWINIHLTVEKNHSKQTKVWNSTINNNSISMFGHDHLHYYRETRGPFSMEHLTSAKPI